MKRYQPSLILYNILYITKHLIKCIQIMMILSNHSTFSYIFLINFRILKLLIQKKICMKKTKVVHRPTYAAIWLFHSHTSRWPLSINAEGPQQIRYCYFSGNRNTIAATYFLCIRKPRTHTRVRWPIMMEIGSGNLFYLWALVPASSVLSEFCVGNGNSSAGFFITIFLFFSAE